VKSNSAAYSSPCPINTATTAIYDLSGNSRAPAPTADPLPTIDWAGVAAQQAASTASCTNGQSLYAATFALTPTYSYTCSVTDTSGTTTLGSINYNSSTHSLTLSGILYFSGSLDLSTTSQVTYSGLASIFVAGTISASNNAWLCVHVSGGTCDFANATNSSSPDYWDTTQSVLILQAQGAITATNLAFQGGLYSSTSINLGGGQSATQGPLVSPQIITPGQQLNTSFPSFPLLYSGTLGTSPPPFVLSSVYGGSF
jgi:hypothetical protein